MGSFFSTMFGTAQAPASGTKQDPMTQAIVSGDIAKMAFLANQARKGTPQQGSRPHR